MYTLTFDLSVAFNGQIHGCFNEDINTNMMNPTSNSTQGQSAETVCLQSARNLPELSKGTAQPKTTLLTLSGQLTGSVSPCVETAPERPTSAPGAFSK